MIQVQIFSQNKEVLPERKTLFLSMHEHYADELHIKTVFPQIRCSMKRMMYDGLTTIMQYLTPAFFLQGIDFTPAKNSPVRAFTEGI
jgi:hypothetical protein